MYQDLPYDTLPPQLVLQIHRDRHDEKYDYDCPICDHALTLAARAWDSTGTDQAAVAAYTRKFLS